MSLRPTLRMKRLYHHVVRHRWDEPADLVVFERSRAAVPGALDQVHVGIWDADEGCDVTSFMTFGMSELTMPKDGGRAEMTLAVRGPLARGDRDRIPILLANLSEYPFANDCRLDWWERIANPGPIPAFPGCRQLLLAPMFGEDPFEHFPAPDEDVKVISVVPITPSEAHVLEAHGREAFLDHWETTGIDIFAPRSDNG